MKLHGRFSRVDVFCICFCVRTLNAPPRLKPNVFFIYYPVFVFCFIVNSMKRKRCFAFPNFYKYFSCSTKKLNMASVLFKYKRNYIYIFNFCLNCCSQNLITFGSFEWHQDCIYWIKTNEKTRGRHLTLSFWEINPTCIPLVGGGGPALRQIKKTV